MIASPLYGIEYLASLALVSLAPTSYDKDRTIFVSFFKELGLHFFCNTTNLGARGRSYCNLCIKWWEYMTKFP
jgi:hypothetical protein